MNGLLVEPIINIAGMRAVLSVRVAVRGKRTTASGTREMVDGFAMDLFKMMIPPFLTTGPAAKTPVFSSQCLLDRLSAIWTEDD